MGGRMGGKKGRRALKLDLTEFGSPEPAKDSKTQRPSLFRSTTEPVHQQNTGAQLITGARPDQKQSSSAAISPIAAGDITGDTASDGAITPMSPNSSGRVTPVARGAPTSCDDTSRDDTGPLRVSVDSTRLSSGGTPTRGTPSGGPPKVTRRRSFLPVRFDARVNPDENKRIANLVGHATYKRTHDKRLLPSTPDEEGDTSLENVDVEIGSLDEGFNLMRLKSDLSGTPNDTTSTPGSDRSHTPRARLDWSSLQIGLGAGQVRGMGDGQGSLFDMATPRPAPEKDRAKNPGSPNFIPEKMRFVPREQFTKKEMDRVQKLAQLSPEDIMAGIPLHPDPYRARSVHDDEETFVPRLCIAYNHIRCGVKMQLKVSSSTISRPTPGLASPFTPSNGTPSKGDQGVTTADLAVGQTSGGVNSGDAKDEPTDKPTDEPTDVPTNNNPDDSPTPSLRPVATPKPANGDQRGLGIGGLTEAASAIEAASAMKTPKNVRPSLTVKVHAAKRPAAEYPAGTAAAAAPANERENLICVPYLGPPALFAEVTKAIKYCAVDFKKPRVLRRVHTVLFWNLFWHFRALGLPLDSLLGRDAAGTLRIEPLPRRFWESNLLVPIDRNVSGGTAQAVSEPRASIIRGPEAMEDKVNALSPEKKAPLRERGNKASIELKRVYSAIVTALERKKIAKSMEIFLEGRMYVESSLDPLYLFLLGEEESAKPHLQVKWKQSMYKALESVVESSARIRKVYPTHDAFHKAYENVDPNFFRKDKREHIRNFDKAPLDIVVKIRDKFSLARFFDESRVDELQPPGNTKSASATPLVSPSKIDEAVDLVSKSPFVGDTKERIAGSL